MPQHPRATGFPQLAPRATAPSRARATLVPVPALRGSALEHGPSDNDTGIPETPSDKDPGMPKVGPARDDTGTKDWDATTASQQGSAENRDGKKPDKTPEEMPDRVDQVIDGGQKIETVDSPPSPADIPEDMEFDPEGEAVPPDGGTLAGEPPVPAPVPDSGPDGNGIPGITPPAPAPVPEKGGKVEKDYLAPENEDQDGMDYLLPLGGKNTL